MVAGSKASPPLDADRLVAVAQGKHGKNTYRIEDCGFKREAINHRFRDYVRRFAILTRG